MLTMTRHPQMASLYSHALHASQGVNVWAVVIPFTAPWLTLKHLFVEFAELAPIVGDDVDVGVSRCHAGS